jgi:hypothetical protein
MQGQIHVTHWHIVLFRLFVRLPGLPLSSAWLPKT